MKKKKKKKLYYFTAKVTNVTYGRCKKWLLNYTKTFSCNLLTFKYCEGQFSCYIQKYLNLQYL